MRTTKIIIILLSLLFLEKSFSQSISINKKKHYFGSIYKWENKPVVFKISNTSSSPINIYTISPQNITTILSSTIINPTETILLYAFFKPIRNGKFNQNISLFSSKDSLGSVRLEGDIKNIEECFSFKNNQGVKKSIYNQNFIVLDSITRLPIPKAELIIMEYSKKSQKLKTDKNGIINTDIYPGRYLFDFKSPNHHSKHRAVYLKRNASTITILLKEKPIITISTKPEIELDSTIISKTKQTKEIKDIDSIKTIEIPRIEKADSTLNSPSTILSNKYAPNNVVFLIDVSYSMQSRYKLPRLKIAVKNLISILRNIDTISLITYERKVKIIKEGVHGSDKESMYEIIDSIIPKGGTYGLSGLNTAFETAQKYYTTDANNQIFIATDGAFNSPDYSYAKLKQLIKEILSKGIKVSVIGFGQDDSAVKRMQNIAKLAKGDFIYITKKTDPNKIISDIIRKQSGGE